MWKPMNDPFDPFNPLNDRQAHETGTAGVIARPPLLFLGALLLGSISDQLLALPFDIPDGVVVRWTLGGSMIVLGLVLAVSGIRSFSRAATPVRANKATRALVTTGIHAWTRNPIYLGMFLIYAGIGIAALSPWTLIYGLPLAIAIRYGVVAREEAYLERRFSNAYRDYKARVRRWL
jgi:protein-S-isoprenylcysteine O-methyltransferase Ste14